MTGAFAWIITTLVPAPVQRPSWPVNLTVKFEEQTLLACTLTLELVEEPTMIAPPVTVQVMLLTPLSTRLNVLVVPGQTLVEPVMVKIGLVVIVAVRLQEGLLTQPALLVVINVKV